MVKRIPCLIEQNMLVAPKTILKNAFYVTTNSGVVKNKDRSDFFDKQQKILSPILITFKLV